MSLTDVTRDAVLSAIAEYDELGSRAFLERYGFGPARVYELVHDGKRYDSKAIVGVAHQYVRDVALEPQDFSGGEQTVVRLLRRLGFVVTPGSDPVGVAASSTIDTGELRRDLQAVLDLADRYSQTITPDMVARDAATRRCVDDLRSALGTMGPALGLERLDLHVQEGGRQANYSPVPWVRLYSRRFSPTATAGFYLVYLFAADGSRVYLSLNQGTSEFRTGSMRPISDRAVLLARAAEARTTLGGSAQAPPMTRGRIAIDLAWQSMTSVGPESRRRIRNYEDANILAYEYRSGAIPSNEQLLSDLAEMVPVVALLYGTVVDTSAGPQSPVNDDDTLGSSAIAQAAARRTQGRQLDTLARLAIERYAEDKAAAHFEALGWTVQRVGHLKRGYDLECVHPEMGTLHVEVKGTQTLGEEVALTPNEVRHNQQVALCDADHALFVVSEIQLVGSDLDVQCSEGREHCVWPWCIEDASLTPTQYAYRVPGQ